MDATTLETLQTYSWPGNIRELQNVIERWAIGEGLSISRSTVEAHTGRLWATRNEGPGATFQFALPGARPGNGGRTQDPH